MFKKKKKSMYKKFLNRVSHSKEELGLLQNYISSRTKITPRLNSKKGNINCRIPRTNSLDTDEVPVLIQKNIKEDFLNNKTVNVKSRREVDSN